MTEAFPAAVYLLCLMTSAACAALLVRRYMQTRARLLLWSGICFVFLAANNLILVLDLIVWPGLDFRIPRLLFALAASVSLIWGFICCSESEAR